MASGAPSASTGMLGQDHRHHRYRQRLGPRAPEIRAHPSLPRVRCVYVRMIRSRFCLGERRFLAHDHESSLCGAFEVEAVREWISVTETTPNLMSTVLLFFLRGFCIRIPISPHVKLVVIQVAPAEKHPRTSSVSSTRYSRRRHMRARARAHHFSLCGEARRFGVGIEC